MTAYRRGLVVGKFAPLHLGHEALVATAAARCDELLVLSYSNPELPGCGVDARKRWLADRFPTCRTVVLDEATVSERCAAQAQAVVTMPPNDSGAEVHWAYLAWLLKDVLRLPVDAMFASEPYVWPCAAFLGQVLGAPVAAHCVDLARHAVPVSGTALRADPCAGRRFLAPSVYADLVRRVVLLGGESSGKTTLAAALAEALRCNWVAEFGRELWERQDGRLAESDLLIIARQQRAREVAAAAGPFLVCDTDPLVTLGYAHWLFGRAEPELERAADRPPYLAVLCAPDFPFMQDGTRRDDAFRQQQHCWYVDELRRRGWPWTLATGDLSERVNQVLLRLHA